MSEKNDDRITLNDDVDKDTQESILHLNQKLSGLLIEINSKLSSPDLAMHHEGSDDNKDHLISLREEVKKALSGIEPLVHMLTGGLPVSTQGTGCYQKELDAIQAMIKDEKNKS